MLLSHLSIFDRRVRTIGHVTSFGDGRHGTGSNAMNSLLYALSYVELLSWASLYHFIVTSYDFHCLCIRRDLRFTQLLAMTTVRKGHMERKDGAIQHLLNSYPSVVHGDHDN